MSALDRQGTAGLFLERVKNILVRPGSEWEVIREEKTSYTALVIGYLGIIAVLPPLSAILQRVVFGNGIAGKQPVMYVLATNVVWYLVILVNMLITAVVITAVSSRDEAGWIGLRGFKVAVYAFTPAFLVSILIIIPRMNWFIYPAVLYSLYLLYLGIRSQFGAARGKAVWYAVTSLGAAGLILGALNLFEYMLESFVTGKIMQ
jgi:Yip1 domain